MRIYTAVIWAVSVLYSPVGVTFMLESLPLKLAKAEQLQLSKLACSNLHGVGTQAISARQYERARKGDAFAEVICLPHGVFNDEPMRFVVDCERNKMEWKCPNAQLEIIVPVATKEVRVRLGSESPEHATELIRKIGSSGFFHDQALVDMLESPCELRPGSTRELTDVKCAGWTITMSAWCPTSDCPRVFSAGPVFQ